MSDSLTRVFEHYLARQLFRRGKLDLAQETHQGMDTGIDQGTSLAEAEEIALLFAKACRATSLS